MSLPLTPPTPFVASQADNGLPAQPVPELNPRCVVCGHENPHGLRLTFTVAANGVAAQWVPGKNWESFQGIVHGGVISTVLDEAMSKAIIARGMEAFTVELRVRFRRKLHIAEQVRAHGWMVRQQRRKMKRKRAFVLNPGRSMPTPGAPSLFRQTAPTEPSRRASELAEPIANRNGSEGMPIR